MSSLIPVALFGWPLLVMLMFCMLPARRAAMFSLVLAWMFLPISGYKVEGLPAYDKISATNLAVLLGTLVFQFERLWRFRWSIFDIPMILFCVAPFISLQAVGFPLSSSIYWSLEQCLQWGLPYFLGRLYIRELSDISELARVLLMCGLIYAPLCLFEIRMSPQLHRIVYGFTQDAWGATKRAGGWRPLIFMQTGLMVATFMCSAAVLALWGWQRRAVKPILGLPAGMVTLILLLVAILCKSAGATVLMMIAIGTLFMAHLTKRAWVLLLLIATPMIYISSRVSGAWDGSSMVSAANMISTERADSIKSRLGSEENFIRHALKRPVVGWGPGPQAMPPIDERVQRKAIWDAMWIINLTKLGLLGLVAWLLVGTAPSVLFIKAFGVRNWDHPGVAAGFGLIAVLACYQVDCLFNSMIQPIFSFALGGIATVALARLRGLAASAAPAATRGLVRSTAA